MDWQPIATAPKKTAILICAAGWPGSVWIARDLGIKKRLWHRGRDGARMNMDATHWIPLPVPPSE